MKEQGDCTSGVCPGASANGETVSIYVRSQPPAAPAQARSAVGGALRGHDAPLAARGQKHRWPPWLAVGCGLVCALGGVDAGEAPQRTRDGSVRGRECGGAGVHWPPGRPPARRFGIIPTSPGPMRPWAKTGVEEINALMLHVAKDCGFADVSILSSDTTAQELPIGYPNEPGILRGLAQRCGRALAKLKTRAVVGVDTALAQVQTILRTVKEHHLFAKGKQAKRQVLTRLLTEVGQLIVQTRLLVEGLGARRDRVTQQRPHHPADHARGGQAPHPTDRAVDHHGRSGQGQNRACRCDAGAGACAPQGGERGRVWPAVSAESPRWWVCLWDVDPWGGGRVEDALAGAGGVPRDLWGARHARVDGLRPGWLCHGDPEGAGPRGGQGDWHSAQRPTGRGALPRPSARRSAASVARPKGSLAP